MGKITSSILPEQVDYGYTFFGTNTGTSAGVFDSCILSTGDQIIVGYFQEQSFSTANKKAMKITNLVGSTATVDSTFSSNLGTSFTTGSIVWCVDRNSSDIIFCGGAFTALNGTTRNRFTALNSNGTVNTSFQNNLGTAFNGTVYDIVVQSDDKVLVGGAFTQLNGTTRNYLVRLNSDGTVDSTFYTNLGTGFNGNVRSIKIQPDGKILVGGEFTQLNGNTRNRYVRLNSDGTEDGSFYTNLGSGFAGTVFDSCVLSDDTIIIVGSFTTFDGNTRNYIVRVSSAGVEDVTFYTNLGTGFNATIYCIDSDPFDRLYIGGLFTTYNSVTRNYYVRILTDGTDTVYVSSNNNSYTSSNYRPRHVDARSTPNRIYWSAGIE